MQHIGHPLVGDPTYGPSKNLVKGLPENLAEAVSGFPRQALHAYRLSFIHPDGEHLVSFEAPRPADIRALLDVLEAEAAWA